METKLSPLEKWTSLYDSDLRQLFFYILLKYNGTIDINRWAMAVRRSINKYDWFKNFINNNNRWVQGEFGTKCLFRSFADPFSFFNEKVDIHKAPLFRIGISDNDIIFKFHHLITDARGASCLIKSIISNYNEYGEEEPLKGEQIDSASNGAASYLAGSLMRWLKNLFYRSDKIYCLQYKNWGKPGYIYLTINRGDVLLLKQFAKENGCTVNDVFIAILYLAIKDWNSKWGKSADKINLSIPINFKSTYGYRNQFNVISLDLSGVGSDIGISEVGRKISTKMSSIKKNRGDNSIFNLLTNMPLAIGKVAINSDLFSTTTAFSNLGIFSDSQLKLGTTPITGVHFFMGIHPPRSICFASVGYDGEVSLGISYDDKCWDKRLLVAFVDGLIKNITATLGKDYSKIPKRFL